jgi:hypothetical protein
MHRTVGFLALLWTACDGGDPVAPTDVVLGETTFVVVVNPAVNEVNELALPAPGAARDAVSVVDRELGVGGLTGPDGIVIVAPLDPGGERVLELEGGGVAATLTETIADGDLVELAVAAEGSAAETMVRVVYPAARTVVEITPDMGVDAVNAELANSERIVLLRGGTYTGDLVFGGSRVTLFGEGETGGEVMIVGNVTVGGSDNGLRGMRVTGSLEVSGSGGAITFSQIDGPTSVSGSDVVLLGNAFCGTVALGGANIAVVGNEGLAPLGVPDGC